MYQRLTLSIVSLVLTACAGLLKKPEPPQVQLAGVVLTQANLIEQSFILKLQLSNPNDFDLPIKGLLYKIDINDQEFVHGSNLTAITLPAKGSAILEADAKTNLQALARQLRSAKAEENARYRIRGEISTANISLPFEHRGETSLGALIRWLPR